MAKDTVKCKFSHCHCLHESNEVLKTEAVKEGKSSYYHPDCFHIKCTAVSIRDYFHDNVNPDLTVPQYQLFTSTLYSLVFEKGVDIDFLYFALRYSVEKYPGRLKHPAGLHYIIQDKDAIAEWKRLKDMHHRAKYDEHNSGNGEVFFLDLPDCGIIPANGDRRRFSDVLVG